MAFKHFHIENKAGKASIKIIGEISWWKNRSEDFIKMIDDMIAEGIEDLELYINSPGGSMDHANEIINQLHRFEGNKSLVIGAMACSAAFSIMLSFDKENTSCHKNTMGMYHDPSGLVRIMKMSDFDSTKKLYEDLRNDVIDRIAEKANLDKEEVSKRMEKTTWLNSKELKSQGFVGKVLDAKDKVPEGAKNSLQNMGFELPNFFNSVEESKIEEVLKVFEKAKKDIKEAVETGKKSNSNNNDTEMKEIAKKLGLPENATADQIANAIEALENRAKFGDESLVNLCVTKGIKKESAEKSVQNNFEATLELVNGIETPEPSEGDEGDEGEEDGKTKKPSNKKPSDARPSNILEQLKNELGISGASASNKKLEDYTPEELDELEKKDPAKFEQLFNESQYGKVENKKFD